MWYAEMPAADPHRPKTPGDDRDRSFPDAPDASPPGTRELAAFVQDRGYRSKVEELHLRRLLWHGLNHPLREEGALRQPPEPVLNDTEREVVFVANAVRLERLLAEGVQDDEVLLERAELLRQCGSIDEATALLDLVEGAEGRYVASILRAACADGSRTVVPVPERPTAPSSPTLLDRWRKWLRAAMGPSR